MLKWVLNTVAAAPVVAKRLFQWDFIPCDDATSEMHHRLMILDFLLPTSQLTTEMIHSRHPILLCTIGYESRNGGSS